MTSGLPAQALIVLRDLLTNAIVVGYYAVFAHIWFQIPLRSKRVAVCVAINLASHIITRFFIGTSAVSSIVTALTILAIARILWHPSGGFRFWIYLFFCTVSEFILEFLTVVLYLKLCPDAMFLVDVGRTQIYASAPATLPLLIALQLAMFALPLLLMHLTRTRSQRRAKRLGRWRYVLRLTLFIVAITLVMIAFAYDFNLVQHASLQQFAAPRSPWANVPTTLVYLLAAALLLFYGWQTVQQYVLYTRNQSLQDKNDAYQRIVDNTREFRHNISNMLYGFEGVLLTDDLSEIRRYYGELLRRCVLINNENANALNRIQSPALTALLLRKLDRASAMRIPFYLNVSPGFSFDAMPAARLSEALGNLLDNALEAAAKAEAPRVNLTLNHADQYDEILLSNAFAVDADLSFLTGEIRSSKPGHQATGLESARRILQRHPAVCFNQYRQGRYVETCLCVYR